MKRLRRQRHPSPRPAVCGGNVFKRRARTRKAVAPRWGKCFQTPCAPTAGGRGEASASCARTQNGLASPSANHSYKPWKPTAGGRGRAFKRRARPRGGIPSPSENHLQKPFTTTAGGRGEAFKRRARPRGGIPSPSENHLHEPCAPTAVAFPRLLGFIFKGSPRGRLRLIRAGEAGHIFVGAGRGGHFFFGRGRGGPGFLRRRPRGGEEGRPIGFCRRRPRGVGGGDTKAAWAFVGAGLGGERRGGRPMVPGPGRRRRRPRRGRAGGMARGAPGRAIPARHEEGEALRASVGAGQGGGRREAWREGPRCGLFRRGTRRGAKKAGGGLITRHQPHSLPPSATASNARPAPRHAPRLNPPPCPPPSKPV